VLYHRIDGSGPPVVLLHAGVVDSRIWRDVVPLLAPRHTVVTYDQRGYGRSPAIAGPYSNLDDLRELLDELGLARVALVGLSRGGRIALDFALEHPEHVRALVLVASGLRGHPLRIEGTPEQEARWEAAEVRGDPRELAELDLEVWAPLGADDDLRAMFVENAVTSNADDPELSPERVAAERLSELRAPTLVVTADRDVPALNEVGERLAREIPSARHTLIHGADHMVPWRKPEELARIVAAFLG
jgi:3-oxoadipate enol-lactonase